MIHSQIDAYRSPARSSRSADPASKVVDTIFALVSVALVVAACVASVHVWIAPGWLQIPILAALYLLVRALLRHLFDPETEWGPKLGWNRS